jgi:hypothetical protein
MERITLSTKLKKPTTKKIWDHWYEMPRANEPDKTLQTKTVHLLAYIVEILSKQEVMVINHESLSELTLCERGQNRNLFKQLSNVLDISFHRVLMINDKKENNYFLIKHKENMHEILGYNVRSKKKR